MLQIIFIIGLFVGTVFTSFAPQHASYRWQGFPQNDDSHYTKNIYNLHHINDNHLLHFDEHEHKNLLAHNKNNNFDDGHDFEECLVDNQNNLGIFTHKNQNDYNVDQKVPITQNVDTTRPVAVPVIKNIGIPIPHPIAIPIPHAVVVGVPQPYPVHVPVAEAVPITVMRTVAVPVEKKVPYAIEKIVPVPVEKHVAVTVEKYIPVPVEKPYPIHIPIYKHIFHRTIGHNGNLKRSYRRYYRQLY